MKSFSNQKLKPYLPLFVLFIIGFIPFFSYILEGKVLLSSDQIGSLGWKFYFDALLSGEIPLWNRYTLGGMPTFDAIFGDASYPIFIILGFILPLKFLVSYNFILHTFIAGFTSYFLIRKIWKIPAWTAVALATGYMLNTNAISLIYAGHTGKFFVISWLPLGLFFLIRTLSDKGTWKHALGLSTIVTLFVSSSHVQLTYFVLIGFFLYYVYQILSSIQHKLWKNIIVLSLRFWVPILLGISIILFILYPPIKYNELSSVRGTTKKQTYEHATSWSIHPSELASLIIPEFTGIQTKYWGNNPFKINSEYPGLVLLVLAIIGFFLCRTRWMIFWLIIAGVVIIFSLGANTPFFKIFYHLIPGIKNFRAPSMTLFWLVVSCLMISSQFLFIIFNDKKIIKPQQISYIKKGGYIFVGLCVVCALFPSLAYDIWNSIFDSTTHIAKQNQNFSDFTIGAFRSALLTFGIIWAVTYLLLRKKEWTIFGIVLILISVIDLYWINSSFIQEYNIDQTFRKEPIINTLKQDTSEFRVFSLENTFPRKYLQSYLIEDINDFADNEYKVFRQYRKNQHNSNLMSSLKQTEKGDVLGNNLLDMLNVKYLIGRSKNGKIVTARNVNYLPRVYITHKWTFLPQNKILNSLQKTDFNPRTESFISDKFENQIPIFNPNKKINLSKNHIKKDYRKNNSYQYTINMLQDGIVIFSDFYYPHWTATIDTKKVSLLQVNHLFQGLYLTQGKHTIKIQYKSSWIRDSLWVSLLSIIFLSLFLIIFKKSKWLSLKQISKAL